MESNSLELSPCKKPRPRLFHITPGWLWHDMQVLEEKNEKKKWNEGNEMDSNPFPHLILKDYDMITEEKRNEIVKDVIESAFKYGHRSIDLSELNILELPKLFDELVFLTMSTIPDEHISYDRFTTCRELYLNGNQLYKLPEVIFQFKQLKVLCLRRNQLTELSSHIGYLTELEELSIGHNQLRDLPMELFHLKQLQRFYARPNPFLKFRPNNEVQEYGDTLKLKELILRQMVHINLFRNKVIELCPFEISISLYTYCFICHRIYIDAFFTVILFLNLVSENQLPFRVNLCSKNCLRKFKLEQIEDLEN
jgi:hypothetical protein